MKLRRQTLIAVLMTMIFCWSLAVPAFAENGTNAVEAASITTEIQGTKKKTIIIGDSRTANLRQVRNNGKLIYDLLQQDGSDQRDAQNGHHNRQNGFDHLN